MKTYMQILKLCTQLITHLRVRDRTVKIVQYSSQMLLGFYGDQLKAELREALALTRRTASNARKAFWLFKSIGHISSTISLVETLMKEFSWVTLFDLSEQIMLLFYYAFENVVFLTRVKLVTSITEDDIDIYSNWSWFLEDLFCFIAAIIRLCGSLMDFHKPSSILNSDFQALQEERSIKIKSLFDNILNSLIATFELTASMEYVNAWKAILGRNAGDGFVGLFGVTSSTLIIIENALRMWADIRAPKMIN